jgi:hypothetical protein
VLSISTFLSFEVQVAHIPQSELDPGETPIKAERRPAKIDCGGCQQSAHKFTAPPDHFTQLALLDPCAAALDQNDQNDHKQNAGNNPDNHSAVHFGFPFSQKFASYVPQSAKHVQSFLTPATIRIIASLSISIPLLLNEPLLRSPPSWK